MLNFIIQHRFSLGLISFLGMLTNLVVYAFHLNAPHASSIYITVMALFYVVNLLSEGARREINGLKTHMWSGAALEDLVEIRGKRLRIGALYVIAFMLLALWLQQVSLTTLLWTLFIALWFMGGPLLELAVRRWVREDQLPHYQYLSWEERVNQILAEAERKHHEGSQG